MMFLCTVGSPRFRQKVSDFFLHRSAKVRDRTDTYFVHFWKTLLKKTYFLEQLFSKMNGIRIRLTPDLRRSMQKKNRHLLAKIPTSNDLKNHNCEKKLFLAHLSIRVF